MICLFGNIAHLLKVNAIPKVVFTRLNTQKINIQHPKNTTLCYLRDKSPLGKFILKAGFHWKEISKSGASSKKVLTPRRASPHLKMLKAVQTFVEIQYVLQICVLLVHPCSRFHP